MMILPMGFARKKFKRPWITIALIVANIAIFVSDPHYSHDLNQIFLKLYSEKVGFNSPQFVGEFQQQCRHFGLTTMACDSLHTRSLKIIDREMRGQRLGDKSLKASAEDYQAFEFINLFTERVLTKPTLAELDIIRQTHAKVGIYSAANSNWVSSLNSMFRHAGWWHLIGNMLMLFLIGVWLEQRMRPELYLLTYLVTGLVANLGYVGGYFPGLGASGAISGVMGMALVFFGTLSMRCKLFAPPYVWNREFYVPTWAFLIFFFLLSDIEAMLLGTEDGVGHAVHLTGWLTGVALAFVYRQFDRAPSFCIYRGEAAKCAALSYLASQSDVDPRLVIAQGKELLEWNAENVFVKEVLVRTAFRVATPLEAQSIVDAYLPQILAQGPHRFPRYRFVFEAALKRHLIEPTLAKIQRPHLRKFLEWSLKTDNLALAEVGYRAFVSRYPKSLDAKNFYEQLRAKKGLHVATPAA